MKLASIILAIGLCRPGIPDAKKAEYAKIVLDGAAATHIDPLLAVAMVDHESAWTQGVVNKSSGAIGFGQILPQFLPPCVGAPTSAACVAEKTRLADGAYNLMMMFKIIGDWQTTCKQKTGTKKEEAWLTAYSGLNSPAKGHLCGMAKVGGAWKPLPIHSLVKQFLARQRSLRLRLETLPP